MGVSGHAFFTGFERIVRERDEFREISGNCWEICVDGTGV